MHHTIGFLNFSSGLVSGRDISLDSMDLTELTDVGVLGGSGVRLVPPSATAAEVAVAAGVSGGTVEEPELKVRQLGSGGLFLFGLFGTCAM